MYKISVFKRFLFCILSMAVVSCGGGGTGETAGGPTAASSTGGGEGGGNALSASTYVLTWDAIADPAVIAYRVYYASSPLSSGRIQGQIETSATSLEFSTATYGMTVGSTLYIAVSALGVNGLESPASNQVSIIVQ